MEGNGSLELCLEWANIFPGSFTLSQLPHLYAIPEHKTTVVV